MHWQTPAANIDRLDIYLLAVGLFICVTAAAVLVAAITQLPVVLPRSIYMYTLLQTDR